MYKLGNTTIGSPTVVAIDSRGNTYHGGPFLRVLFVADRAAPRIRNQSFVYMDADRAAMTCD